jgi:hypothetical protein
MQQAAGTTLLGRALRDQMLGKFKAELFGAHGVIFLQNDKNAHCSLMKRVISWIIRAFLIRASHPDLAGMAELVHALDSQ